MKKNSFLLFCLIYIASFGQNKLDKSKSELNSGVSNRNHSSTSYSSSSGSSKSKSSNGENILGGIIADIFIYATFGVFKYGVVGDYKNENHLYSNLTPYPYYNRKSGNFENSDTVSVTVNKSRFDIENSFVYNSSSLFGNHLKAKIRPFQYLYLQTDFHQLFEINKIDATANRLSLFQFNLNYDRIRLEKFNFGWNLGATYVGNEVKRGGLAYGLNAEYFMGNRISFLASAKWSRINSLPVNTYELQGKFHRNNYFLTLGLEHLKIATPTYTLLAFGGGIYF
ncbi:hypothetical protein [Flavobacterium sp.]|uniref:hypothetical protein n=1 Tax=Flavobacterium sp. TaxID=239 RepID=UPI003BCBC79A